MGSLFLICHYFYQAPKYLFWLGLGYIVPSFSVAAQSFMSNLELALCAPLLGGMYLFGAWASAYAMALRKKAHAHSYWCFGLIVIALLLLSYFSYIDNELWIRMLILNFAIATVESLVLFSIFRHYQDIDIFNKIVDFSYFFIVIYTFVRSLIIYLFLSNIEADMLVTSVWWLIMLAASIFLSMWFAIVLLGTLVRDIIYKLNDERLKDPLTNLLNRRGFYEKAKSALSCISQDTYFLLMCDIDHFKRINDQHGHLIGDSILQQVGQIIRENVRDQDLVGRFGGEEFILLLQVDDQHQAYTIAERIRVNIETSQLSVSKISVTASFGLAQIFEQDFIRAIGVADQLLYSAKRSGRNCIGLDHTKVISPCIELKL
ncbi:GGDEF domain-containing protein [Acinetobacter tibetensis]|uniref:diguanylate cyclase n=1 Tax=Acinetobacter tibetensis TaxID=2943497 RepID=A0AAE9LU98_9GAMM|nr:GGDEF domain-containing protein [Acinetobacter tibetensis]USE84838.1 GGDEF domain-containing protein [Acinetobacter tibetensis]